MGERVRLRFSKTGKAKYISHLDLMATMRRALLRSGVRLSYSEGFNPHPYLSAALPLQVGCGSVCELIDFETAGKAAEPGTETEAPDRDKNGDRSALQCGDRSALQCGDHSALQCRHLSALPDRMNEVLPEGIEVYEAYAAERKFKDIAWLEVCGELYYNGTASEDIGDALESVFSSHSIVISKKTKRGFGDVDIATFIKDVKVSNNSIVRISAVISAQNPTITPGDLLAALSASSTAITPRFALFTRTQVFDREMQFFR